MSPSSRISLSLSVISYLSPTRTAASWSGQLDGWRLLSFSNPTLPPLSCFLYEPYLLFLPDIRQHIWLYNPQTWDITFVGKYIYPPIVFRPFHLLLTLSRSANKQDGLFEDARKALAVPFYLRRPQTTRKAGQRTGRFVV